MRHLYINAHCSMLRCVTRIASLTHVRQSWSNKFSSLYVESKKQSSNHIVEILNDSDTNVPHHELILDLKHFLRSYRMPKNIRRKILGQKIVSLSKITEPFTPNLTHVIDGIFAEAYELHDNDINLFMSFEEQLDLFSKSAFLFTSQTIDRRLPRYVSLLIKNFLRDQSKHVPTSTLASIVELGAMIRGIEHLLTMLLYSFGPVLTPQFSNSLIELQLENNTLTLSTFEILATQLNLLHLVNTKTINHYRSYIEKIFKDSLPKVHEYKDLNRNMDRIVNVMSNFLQAKSESVNRDLQAIQLSNELLKSCNSLDCKQNLENLIDKLFSNPEMLNEINNVLLLLDLDSEALAMTVLFKVWGDEIYRETAQGISSFISLNDIQFSPLLRFQARLHQEFSKYGENESEIASLVIVSVREFISENTNCDLKALHLLIIQCAMIAKLSPRGDFVSLIRQFFSLDHNIIQDILVYKCTLDTAILHGDSSMAMNIFEDSLVNFTIWSQEVDPAVHKTLNDLIVLVCQSTDHILQIFPVFVKIKQHLSAGCNTEAVTALTIKMLQVEYVGDLIEMLKHELPKLNADSQLKLPTTKPLGIKYRALFNVLHEFIIKNNSDTCCDSKWVLYGELHKYFIVPFESYLPALKFFCEHDRHNSALVIFRQIRKLSELHGQSFQAPLRDMYIYLFDQFGKKLYEDGVVEVHEYMKTDVFLQRQDIDLLNSILNAYSNLQDVPRARDFFLSMCAKRDPVDRPNEKTIQIMIKSFTYSDLYYVQQFWNNLSHYKILPNHAIYMQYVIAHSYHGRVQEAIRLIQDIEDWGLEATSELLIAAHNFCYETDGQQLISEYALKSHPSLWKTAVQLGLLVNANNYALSERLIADSSH